MDVFILLLHCPAFLGTDILIVLETNLPGDARELIYCFLTIKIEISSGTEEMDCHVLSGLGPFICHIVQLFLPAKIRIFFDLFVTTVLDDIGVLDCIGGCHLVPSNWLVK